MRKRIISRSAQDSMPSGAGWLDLERLAEVEVTSEDVAHPIEAAVLSGGAQGWRAGEPGRQVIRLLFASPQPLRRIWLRFAEPALERTQEFVLRWSPDGGQSFREIVRQQWNFSPQGSTSETADHRVDLPGVTVLELGITPDIAGGDVHASLAELRVA